MKDIIWLNSSKRTITLTLPLQLYDLHLKMTLSHLRLFSWWSFPSRKSKLHLGCITWTPSSSIMSASFSTSLNKYSWKLLLIPMIAPLAFGVSLMVLIFAITSTLHHIVWSFLDMAKCHQFWMMELSSMVALIHHPSWKNLEIFTFLCVFEQLQSLHSRHMCLKNITFFMHKVCELLDYNDMSQTCPMFCPVTSHFKWTTKLAKVQLSFEKKIGEKILYPLLYPWDLRWAFQILHLSTSSMSPHPFLPTRNTRVMMMTK